MQECIVQSVQTLGEFVSGSKVIRPDIRLKQVSDYPAVRHRRVSSSENEQAGRRGIGSAFILHVFC